MWIRGRARIVSYLLCCGFFDVVGCDDDGDDEGDDEGMEHQEKVRPFGCGLGWDGIGGPTLKSCLSLIEASSGVG